jgi:hypothetical protein
VILAPDFTLNENNFGEHENVLSYEKIFHFNDKFISHNEDELYVVFILNRMRKLN